MSTSMQALVLNRYNGPLELTDLSRPVPAAGRVLVRIAASGLNPLDTKIRAGPPRMPATRCRRSWVWIWRARSRLQARVWPASAKATRCTA